VARIREEFCVKLLKRCTYVFFLIVMLGMLAGCSDVSPSGLKDKPQKTFVDKTDERENLEGDDVGDKVDNGVDEESVLIAAALDPNVVNSQRSITAFQDIASFLGIRFEDWQATYRSVDVTEVESTSIVEYVRLLMNEFDFEIVGSTNFDINAEDVFNGCFEKGSWEVVLGLSTIDTGRETKGRIDNTISGDIRLHCDGKGKLTMVFTDLFHTEDFGYRPSNSVTDRFNEVCGQRVWDDYHLENGRYCNGSDGVLSVEAGTNGEAVILINGEKVLYSTHAGVGNEVYVDYACDDYVIGIYDFLDGVEDECIILTVPKTLVGGEVYTLSDGLGKRGDSPIWMIYSPGTSESEGETVRSSDTPSSRAAMNACTARILQWDEVECVVYMSMDIVTELEPMTIEVLVAVPAYGSLWGDTFKEDEAITLKVGETLELEYDGPYVFSPNYETYEWKISSGQGASISGFSDTCKVTAVSQGQIVIKCVYSYGKDEPDVLTGILRNENHTKTKLYYIEIVE